ncbi:hypothetical protein C0991_006211 [Blastosporella zonata]|nr:hypothetical protein C0991_006211 [Blastosporella zonata]
MDGNCFVLVICSLKNIADGLIRRDASFETYAADIHDKMADEVRLYYETFKEVCKIVASVVFDASRSGRICRILSHIRGHPNRGAHLRRRSEAQQAGRLLERMIAAMRFPMQELELDYPTTKGKVYSELLCRLFHYVQADDVHKRLKDVTGFPGFASTGSSRTAPEAV